jgi:RNA polymerase sigma-70 factor, ECF subfamily
MPSLDSEQFVERFVRVQSQVYGYIVTLLPTRADADDIFQQTSLLLWQKRSQYDPSRDFLRWACGIAHNLVRNHLRRHRHEKVYLSDGLMEKLCEVRHAAAKRIETKLQRLTDCLDRLAPEQRELLELCYLGTEPIKTVANNRQVDPSVLYKRLDRIRWTLMDCMDESAGEEERP